MLKKSSFIKLLKDQEILKEHTGLYKLTKLLNSGKKIYLGFDLTAKSLHWGHYFLLLVLNKAWDYGIETIVILGNFTTKIGDSSWRESNRKKLSKEELQKNFKGIRGQIKKLSPKSKIIYNSSFYKNFSLEDFSNLLDFFKVRDLSRKDFFCSRLSKNILTFKDTFYPMLQSYDFYKLALTEDVAIQMGGNDQWGNITIGLDYLKKLNKSLLAGGFTICLLTDSAGKKIGKSGENTLFLDKKLTSPYAVYQYFWNLPNDNLKYLSKFLFDEEINSYTKITKERRTEVIRKLLSGVYSEKSIKRVKKISELLFFNKFYLEVKNFTEWRLKELSNVLPYYKSESLTNISKILIELGFSKSHSESKRLVELGKCVSCFNYKFRNHKEKLDPNLSVSSYFLIKKGEKNFGIFHLSSKS